MTESVAATIDADELQLARLVCGRIAPRLQGLLSVGLGLAQADALAANLFLRERFPDLEAHARVLHTIRGGTGPGMRGEHLHEQSRRLLEAVQRLGSHVDREEGSRGGLGTIFRPMRTSFLLLCDALAEYARLIALDPFLIERMKAVCLSIFDQLDRSPSFAEENAPCTSSIPTST